MRSMKIVVACLLCCVFAALLPAQSTNATISGAVLDSSGASVVGAKVTLTDQQRGTATSVTTEMEGRFVFPIVQPGVYTISIQQAGFKSYEKQNINVSGNDRLALGTISLDVGAVGETVKVTAQAIQLQTESGERSDTIIGEQIQNIAVNGRSYLALTSLLPGVVNTNNYQTPGHGGVAGIFANGARSNQNQLTVNGISNVDTGNNGDQLATFSLDAVEEFKMLTGTYQAEYGRSAGAQISVVTKSGTSQFHGSGYWYHRHEGLNANNWKNNRDGLQKNKFRSNNQGYTIGGPVFIPKIMEGTKEKLFFFWSQEYQRNLKPQNRRDLTLPTALERQGDFSQTVDNNGNPFPYIRDTQSGLPCNASNTAGCFQDGGVIGRIPKSRLYGPGLAILNIFPLPNNPGKGFNYSSQISDSYPRREDLGKIDYNATSKIRLFGHFINNNDVLTSYYGSFVLGANVPIVPITDARPGKSIGTGMTWVISPTMTNEVNFGYGHNQINIDATTNALTKAKLGLSGLPILYPQADQQDYTANFQFNGSRLANQPTLNTDRAPFFNYNTTLDWSDNFTKVFSRHTVKAGIFAQRSRKDQTTDATSSGLFNFGDTSSNPLDTGYGYANAAIGVYQTFTQANSYATGKYRYWDVEAFVQDTWKVSRRLTLDYGLRIAFYQPQYDSALQTSTFSPQAYSLSKASVLYRPALDAKGNKVAYNPVTGELAAQTLIGKVVPSTANITNGIQLAGKDTSKYLMDTRYPVWGPRFGFAYDVTGKSNIVVRGGGGIFYDRYQGNMVFSMLGNPPTTVQPTLFNGNVADINPANAVLAPQNIFAFAQDGKLPTVYNYSLGIQYKLPSDFVLDVAYVGSQSRHLLQRVNLNAIPYGATFLAQNQDPTKVASSPNAILGSNALDRDFLRPYPGFGDITLRQFGGTSNYNSLQTSVNRRFGKQLFLQVSYTWSKALGTTSGDDDYIRIDNNTVKANYGPLTFDRRHNLAVNYVYDAPAGSKLFHNSKVAGLFLDGWQLSGITRFQTGAPFNVGYSIPGVGNQNLTGSYTEGTRVVGTGISPNTGSDSPYYRINPAAFSLPYVGSRGLDIGNNFLYGPGINNWDMSLQKEFAVKERVRFQLRLDAFNAFNHTQFSGLNTTINFKSLTDPTITNLPFNANGTVNNINGFGTVSGARDPRFLQTMLRVQF